MRPEAPRLTDYNSEHQQKAADFIALYGDDIDNLISNTPIMSNEEIDDEAQAITELVDEADGGDYVRDRMLFKRGWAYGRFIVEDALANPPETAFPLPPLTEEERRAFEEAFEDLNF